MNHHLTRPTTAPPLYAQDGDGYGAIVHAHYFVGGCDWLATEYDPETDIAFGWTRLHGDQMNAELGYFDMTELEEVRVPSLVGTMGHPLIEVGLPIEFEEDWTPTPLRDAIALLDRRLGLSSEEAGR